MRQFTFNQRNCLGGGSAVAAAQQAPPRPRKLTPLSDGDIKRILPGCKVLKYSALASMQSLDELLGGAPACILLYETEKNQGHWVTVFKRLVDSRPVVSFYDSYGVRPDDELKWVPACVREDLGEDTKQLLRLLYDSGLPVVFNDSQHQALAPGVATCGRHCILRLLLSALDEDEYDSALRRLKKKGEDLDDVVCDIVY